jgi:acetylornithine deacetylase
MSVPIDQERVTSLLSELVRIESVNPFLDPVGSGEGQIAEFVADFLTGAGIPAELHEVSPGRSNVLGTLAGTGGGPTLVLNAHLDTVSVRGMQDPFTPRQVGDRLFGRGSCDDKSGVAVGIEVLIALKELGVPLAGDVVFAGVIDEEASSLGTEALVRQVRADGCIVLEPSLMSKGLIHAIGIGSGGFVWADIETQGRAAHGSLHQVGIDAIAHMGAVLSALSQSSSRLLSLPPYRFPLANHHEGHKPSLHNSLIRGGTDLSTYPAQCVLSVERRLVLGETLDQVQAELDEVLVRASSQLPGFQGEARIVFSRAPWQAEEGLLLEILEAEVEAQTSREVRRYASSGWNEGSLFTGAGIPTLVFGPAGDGWHAPEEWVDTRSVAACASMVANTAARFCGDSRTPGSLVDASQRR